MLITLLTEALASGNQFEASASCWIASLYYLRASVGFQFYFLISAKLLPVFIFIYLFHTPKSVCLLLLRLITTIVFTLNFVKYTWILLSVEVASGRVTIIDNGNGFKWFKSWKLVVKLFSFGWRGSGLVKFIIWNVYAKFLYQTLGIL
jgi:hypothetical protein